ncbi:MAG: phosphoglucosamine mutase [Candidatus Improbicoccus devescovinae]|nr:MAG: phosphoglucosamine mutase [Candidatus Improbicoccus devescovinae]
MSDINFEKFKSGSDIRAKASELTTDVLKKICFGFATWIHEEKDIRFENQVISIGTDSRISNTRIKNIIINMFRSLGIFVYDCQLASTPAISMAVKLLSCSAAIEITASHMPAEYNGLKFFSDNGSLQSEDIQKILKFAQNKNILNNNNYKIGQVKHADIISKYCNMLIKLVTDTFSNNKQKPFKNLSIIVDASNGAGGFFAEKVLKVLGADVSHSVLLEPDGNFPVHAPNPDDMQALEYVRKIVLDTHADLGIIFDADVDRIGIIDSKGQIISKNSLLALASALVLRQYYNPGTVIVTDSVVSDYLEDFITSLGGLQFRHKRGYINVINAAKQLNKSGLDCPLAIETSGHIAFRDHDFIDDGAYFGIKVAIECIKLKQENQTLSDLIKDFKISKESREIRIELKNKNTPIYEARNIIQKLKKDYINIKNCEIVRNNPEGIRLNFKNSDHMGWCILRKSIHEPMLVLYIESDISGGVSNILAALSNIIINIKDLKL